MENSTAVYGLKDGEGWLVSRPLSVVLKFPSDLCRLSFVVCPFCSGGFFRDPINLKTAVEFFIHRCIRQLVLGIDIFLPQIITD